MEKSKDRGVAITYILYIFVVGTVSAGISGFRHKAMLGLLAGFLAAFVNYGVLGLTVRRILGSMHILAVQIFLLRYLLYIMGAYVCMRIGDIAIIMYAVGVTGLSLTIFIVYGIGGLKINDKR